MLMNPSLLAASCPSRCPNSCLVKVSFFEFDSVFLTTVCCCAIQFLSLFGLVGYLYYAHLQVSRGRQMDFVILPYLQPIAWVCTLSTAVVLALLLSEFPCVPNFFRLSDDYTVPGAASIGECFEFFAYWFFESVKYLSVGIIFIGKSMSRRAINQSVLLGVLAAFFLACLYSLPFVFARTDLTRGDWTQPFAGAVDIAIDSGMMTFYGWTIGRRNERKSIRPFAVYNIIWHGLSLTLSIIGFVPISTSWTDLRYFVSLLKFFIRYFVFVFALNHSLVLDTLYWRGYNRKPILAHSHFTVEVKPNEWEDPRLVHGVLDENADKLIDFTELKAMKRIGVGGTATVYEGMYKNHRVAIKVFTPRELDADSIRDYQYEIIMCEAASQSPFSLKFYGVCVRPPHLCLVFELCTRGDLRHVISGNTLSQAEKFKIGKQCVAAIEHLHNVGLLHHDIKPENFFLCDDLKVKLGDYGLAKRISSGIEGGRPSGTPGYMAPEKLEKQPYDCKVDIFACGIMLWELFCQRTAFSRYGSLQLDMHVLAGHRPSCKHLHPSVTAILSSAWATLPKDRPDAKELSKQLQELEQDFIDKQRSIFLRLQTEDEFKSGGTATSSSGRVSIIDQVRTKLSRVSRGQRGEDEEEKHLPRVGSLQDRPVLARFNDDEEYGESRRQTREPSGSRRSISEGFEDLRKSFQGRKSSTLK